MKKHWENEITFSDFIISHLLSCKSIRIQRRVLYDLVQKKRRTNRQIVINNLCSLKNKGIINFDSQKDIVINKKELQLYVRFKNMKVRPTGETQVLVLFDIPEKKRKIRNWVRLQLKLWNFKMIQQSAWLGDGPLPKEFINHLNLLDVKECVKVFKIQARK